MAPDLVNPSLFSAILGIILRMVGNSHVHRPKLRHTHGHHHAHTGHRSEARQRLLWCMLLTGVMMIAEGIGGWWTNSLALLSDAGHMLTHFFALSVSYLAIRFAARPPTPYATYGYYRVEVLAALLNAVTLVAICGWIIYEAGLRLAAPEPVASLQMSIVAVLGFLVNLTTAWILQSESKGDMNVKGAYLHMLGDTLSSVAVIAGGIVMAIWGWYIIDPLLSILICLVILYWAYGLTRDAVRVLMEATPPHIVVPKIAPLLRTEIAGIVDVHDLHVWEITSGMYAMTAHVQVDDVAVSHTMQMRREAEALLDTHFDISHVILQFEC